MKFPNIDRIIWHVGGPFAVSWYSLSYVIGIILGYLYCRHLINKYKLRITKNQLDDLINYLLIAIVGARLGYVLVYDPLHYLSNPIEILKIYEGGLSFHGGLIGAFIGAYLFSRNQKVSMLEITDLLAAASPITIFFARIANFINCELVGRITDVPWAVLFPPQFLPRHPSQIYESLSEGLLTFIVLNLLIKKYRLIESKGAITGAFLILYAINRIICEFFREPDIGVGFIADSFTMGQILSLPMILVGILCLLKKR
ncbi:prolipoprotein diacylglyceryl transferase [Candidatus Phycorickettsia trachydisci]|uniref:prolipoprotein diacylglyceryl transferase n=1 Tax=Candidatus Phycorickettsia trachydisci TaxID=2115978 RepID=UPI000D11CAE8|nr:prolipoprotein diacylglyceryl transferase [Candidatus Phycorickettsia trachydisci]